MSFVGIDNGVDGGIVALDEQGGILEMHVMPVRKTGKGSSKVVDPKGFQDLVFRFADSTFVVEQAAKFTPGKNALCSTWYSWGMLRAVLELAKVRFEPIDAQRWQKVMMPGRNKDTDTKVTALEVARRLWPNEAWLKSEKCTKPHDGLIDAALIAEYGRRLRL